ATPTAIIVGTGKGAENNILIKNSEALEKVGSLKAIVFDKTGTLTKGSPEVTDIISLREDKENEVLLMAALAEKGSEHPLGEAIIRKAENLNMVIPEADRFEAVPGKGVIVKAQDREIILGNKKLLSEKGVEISDLKTQAEKLENEGKTTIFISLNSKLIGLIAVTDLIKENAQKVIGELKAMGLEVYLITGDNKKTAEAVGKKLKITEVLAEVLPGDKADKIKEIQEEGKDVAMVGDGINDAPALARANVGIALGSGTDVAIETGDIVLVRNDLRDVLGAIKLSLKTMKKIKQNLFWAFFYNSAGIPIAAGVFYPFFRVLLKPEFAALAMALSSVSVITNSLLLKRFKPS
ncbi:MAG: heavy metal translocating P-type ATPase, partial [Actinomycetia bacterium]|nr:heavy metal translocating P-type ATPase [Actinomycetes bacterium]